MKSNDFRIGNLVQTDCGISKITEIRQGEAKLIDGDFWKIEGCEPILLDGDWLLRCDFNRIDHIGGYSFYSLSKSKKNKCQIDIYLSWTKFNGIIVNNCKYVHQLQNLYFAVTGKELVIKQ